jgi:hypothetical protein
MNSEYPYNLSVKDLLNQLLQAGYDVGFHMAACKFEFAKSAAIKREILRQEVERRLTVAEFTAATMSDVY